MANIEDFYEILGLEPTASADEIRTAYRQKARRVHPDAAGIAGTAEFVRINRAYETLIDPHRRQTYDQEFLSYCRETRSSQMAVGREWLGPSTTLGSLLAEMMSALGQMAGPGVEPEMEVSAIHAELVLASEAAWRGSNVRLDVPVPVVCSNCQGTGLAEPFVCPVCRGRGRWQDNRPVRFFLPPPIRDGQTVTIKLQAADVPAARLYLHVRLSWL